MKLYSTQLVGSHFNTADKVECIANSIHIINPCSFSMLVNPCQSITQGLLNQEIWHCFYIEDKVGISIIVIIPHCHTENALKRSKHNEMWLRL